MKRKPKDTAPWLPNEGKLPRGHAYIRVRNRGYSIHMDYCEVDSAQAERIIRAAMAIVKEDDEKENPNTL